MKKNIKKYIKLCVKYVIKKTSKQLKMRKHQSFPASKKSFKKKIMNFITEFSESQDLVTRTSYDIIITIMNEFTKYVKFISC